MDSGASRHLCKESHLFKTYSKVVDGEALYMGNNSSIKVQGKGQVELVFTSRNILILRYVYNAPEISRNLVSGPTMYRLGYKLVFESDRCIISKILFMLVDVIYLITYLSYFEEKHVMV